MVTLSAPAKAQLDSYFDSNAKSAIRIFLISSSCAGTRLTLALDEPKESDTVHQVDGYDFIVDKELYAEAQPLGIDFACSGFLINSQLQLGNGLEGDCSCSGGCCG